MSRRGRWPIDIRIEQPRLQPEPRESQSEIDGDRRFSNAALATRDSNDRSDSGIPPGVGFAPSRAAAAAPGAA